MARRSLAAIWARAAASPRLKGRILRLTRKDARLAALLNRLQAQLHTPPAASADEGVAFFARDTSQLSAEARTILDVLKSGGSQGQEVP
jgi:hypothetical protein